MHTKLKNNLILAPLAGFSTPPVRRFFSQSGAGLCVTEMVSAKAILHNNEKTKELLFCYEAEKIRSVQLFGSDPSDFAKAIGHEWLRDFDIIDINMGCPVRKITSNGEGSALMADAQKAGEIVESAVKAAKKLGKIITVKTRLGIKDKSEVLKFAPVLEEAGAVMICVHGRTAVQMYSGEADYDAIRAARKVIKNAAFCANGDIVGLESYEKAKATEADYFMIGRGALMDVRIFKRLSGDKTMDKKQDILRLIDYMTEYYGGAEVCMVLRKFLPYMLKGVKGGKDLRTAMYFSEDINELRTGINRVL